MPKGEGAGAEAEPRALAEPTRSPKTARKANQKPRQRKTETRRSEPSTITVGGFFHGTGKAKPTAPQGARASEKRGRLDRAGTVAIKAQSNNILRLFCDYSLRLKSRPEALIPLTCGFSGAGDGNRTRVISLEGWGSTIELRPQDMVGTTGFEPATSCSQSRRATKLRHVPKVLSS